MRAISKSILETPISQVLTSMDAGTLPALVSGLSHIHRANIISAVQAETSRQVFVLCPDENTADNLEKDISAFSGVGVLKITAREFTFYTAESVSRQAEQKRIAVLDSMLTQKPEIVICTVSGMMQRTMPPSVLLETAFTISAGEEISLETAETGLLNCGYLLTDQVEGPGQYARRGGILDFFSPAYDMPVRCEFWGDTVDTMGFFETVSQRRTESIDLCRILPASETLSAACEGGALGLSQSIDELAARASRQKAKNEKLISVLKEDSERLAECASLAAADRYMALIWQDKSTVLDYMPPDAIVIISEPSKAAERARSYAKTLDEDVKSLLTAGIMSGHIADFYLEWNSCIRRLKEYAIIMADAFTVGRYPIEPRTIVSVQAKQLPAYGGSIETAVSDVKQYIDRSFRVVVLAGDERKAKVLSRLFEEQGVHAPAVTDSDSLPEAGHAVVAIGSISAGFEYPEANIAVLTDNQMASGGFKKPRRRKAVTGKQSIGSHTDLSAGDLVVHEYHGIGKFLGIFKMPVEGVEKDYIKISYSGRDSLYVPATSLDLVSKYVGGGEGAPVKLSKMGGTEWSKTKSRAKAAAKDMAKELIALYAQRSRLKGYAFGPDTPWQAEFEQAFGYSETDDQLRCITEIKQDMEKPVPMDRLLCGDVGYGKTEVALRAIMKCVMEGKQAALLVPTTVLAQQHYKTAMQRFFGYPVNIEILSRFRTPAQVKKTLQDIETGAADIVIGTHRIIQKDIKFKNLGLLIIDEEQRFGVSHKEQLKEMSRQVDVLTLSATPIPRTLNLALSGIRDMSTIEEPPQDRLPVQTYVLEHDWGIICDAIRREVNRGGQVYYLHNRVENIERTALRISSMMEDISVTVAHGKMDEESITSVMEGMVAGEYQVLVCTTIIETGIDIPNANTLIIEDADKLGLAQLHQIRGRVGRSSRKASAYLTFRKDKVLSEVAEKRLSAIREFAEFNSGFNIAMRDLEIRGAGNLLGSEQSGHLVNVGYDMYLKLLQEAVLEERGEAPQSRAECSADLAVSANIPETFVASPEQRMDIYRRIAMIRSEDEADDLLDELIDRFGDPPSSVNALVHVALLRGEATTAGIVDISQKSGMLCFTLHAFDIEKISLLYEKTEYKGRIKVEAGQKPCIALKLKSGKQIVQQARKFVSDFREVS